MRNRYSPPESPVSDQELEPGRSRLRTFGVCAATSAVFTPAMVIALLAAAGRGLDDEVLLGLLPTTLVGTLLLAYLASDLS